MSRFEDGGSAKSSRERWCNAPVEWGRIFRGMPFTIPHFDDADSEREWREIYCTPLPYPVLAVGPCATNPPEGRAINPDTGDIEVDPGKVYPVGPWELRIDEHGVRQWWPVAAHRRAAMREFQRFEKRHSDDDVRRSVERAVADARAGKD